MPVGTPGFAAFEETLNSFYETGTWKCMFLTNAHTPDEDLDVFIDDVSANEIVGVANYPAGGITVVPTVEFNTGTNDYTITFPQAAVNNTTGTFRHAVYYQDTGTPATSRIGYQNDTEADITATNGTLQVNATTVVINYP